MSTSRSMTPLSRVLDKINARGFTKEITLDKKGARFNEEEKRYQPEDLIIRKIYRFEGESDPADMSIVYIMEARDGLKGFMINAYGTYSDQDNPYYDEFIVDVPVEEIEDFDAEE